MAIEFGFYVDYIDKADNLVKQRVENITFIDDAKEMHISALSGLETYVYNLALWAKVAIGITPIEKVHPMDISDDLFIKNWNTQKFAEYGDVLIDMLTFFTDKAGRASLKTLHEKRITDMQDLRALANLFVHLYAKLHDRDFAARQYFVHKGREFIIPYDEALVGRALTWGEATEALQSDYMTNNPNNEGAISPEAYLNNTLTIIASLCREVKTSADGTFKTEEPPPKKQEDWIKYLTERKEFLSSLTADVAMDVGFFLLRSYERSANTHFLLLLLSSQKFQKELTASL